MVDFLRAFRGGLFREGDALSFLLVTKLGCRLGQQRRTHAPGVGCLVAVFYVFSAIPVPTKKNALNKRISTHVALNSYIL